MFLRQDFTTGVIVNENERSENSYIGFDDFSSFFFRKSLKISTRSILTFRGWTFDFFLSSADILCY